MIVIIPLGGVGSRFQEKGYNTLKPFIKINLKYILYYLLDTLNNVDFIYIPYNKQLGNLEKFIRHDYPDYNFKFLPLDNTRGAAETISLALKQLKCLDMPILSLDGDSFYDLDIYKLWNGENKIFTITSDKACYSYVKGTTKILDIQEKKVISDMACTGAYGFKSWKTLLKHCDYIIENNKTFCGEFYISTVLSEMISTIDFKIEKIPSYISLGTPKDVIDFYNISILFDLDGTLVDTNEAYLTTWQDILDKYEYVVDQKWYDHNIKGKTDIDVFSSLFPDRSYITMPSFNQLSAQKDLLFSKNIDKITEIPGAINFVKECIQLGIQCGIVTNCNRSAAEQILDKYGLKNLPLTIGAECSKPKPYPDPYIKAKFGTNLSIIFEDSPVGVQSAKASGVDYIIGIGQDNLKNYGATFCIDRFTDIYSIMRMIEDDMNKNNDNYKHLEKECTRILRKPVIIDKTLLKGGYIANIQKVFTDDQIFIIKHENESNHTFHKISQDLLLYDREYYFYEVLSSLVKLKVPKYYGTIYKDEYKKGIILENLSTGPQGLDMTFNPQVDNIQLERIISRIAEMHLQFTDSQDIEALHATNDKLFSGWQEFCMQRWPKFVEKWKGILSDKQLQIGKNIISRFKDIQTNLSTGSLTLVHGDVKLANIAMSKDSEPYFLDWQYIVKGKGIQDIAFFLIESFELQDYDKILTMYKKYIEYSEKDFQDAISYFPVYVAMWFGTVEDKDLIDVNFPKRYVPKLFKILEHYL
jgi:beta-phosphoglucomutase-like phosphatase (HAD superfamily)/dTDP-glucose pyrophosphorylase/fructosamine-3-kinase